MDPEGQVNFLLRYHSGFYEDDIYWSFRESEDVFVIFKEKVREYNSYIEKLINGKAPEGCYEKIIDNQMKRIRIKKCIKRYICIIRKIYKYNSKSIILS